MQSFPLDAALLAQIWLNQTGGHHAQHQAKVDTAEKLISDGELSEAKSYLTGMCAAVTRAVESAGNSRITYSVPADAVERAERLEQIEANTSYVPADCEAQNKGFVVSCANRGKLPVKARIAHWTNQFFRSCAEVGRILSTGEGSEDLSDWQNRQRRGELELESLLKDEPQLSDTPWAQDFLTLRSR